MDEPLTQSGGGGSRPGLPVDPFRLRRALLRRKRLVFGAAIGGLIVGYVLAKYALSSPYESTGVLKFEGSAQIRGMPPLHDALVTSADALRRQAVLRRIADEVGFEGSLSTLGYSIGYEVDYYGKTIWITVPGDSGEDAAQFARTVMDVFMKFHEERQAKRIEVEIGRLSTRIVAAGANAEIARRKYDEFRDAHGIADLSTEQQSVLESAAKLRADNELAVSEIRVLEAQLASLEAQLASTPQTRVISGGNSPERAAYQQLRQQLATARATLSESHPRVQALQQQVNHLRDRLRGGGTTTPGDNGQVVANATYRAIADELRTTKSNLEVLRERQRWMAERAKKAQGQVEAFSDIEGEASGLLAEVRINENLLRHLRQTQAALEDALRTPSSGFVILDPGSVPEYALRNKKKFVVLGAVPLVSCALALLFALWGEFRGFRVQTSAEVAFWGSGPVLGTTSWPNDPLGLEELIAGLDDYAPEAVGGVLIVGASPHEASLATELADRMDSDWVITGGMPFGNEPQPQPIHDTTPIQAPPPSGPYPISRATPSTALATRPSSGPLQVVSPLHHTKRMKPEAWDGAFEGQALRRAARLADRILVLVHSGSVSALQLNRTRQRLGREDGLGYIVVGITDELSSLPDRMGDVAGFWGVRTQGPRPQAA